MNVGEKQTEMMTEEELDRLLVEMILKMSPGQLVKAAEIVYAAEEEEKVRKEAS